MDCNQCGVCCTEISISTQYPGHPNGKPAGVTCQWLDSNKLCMLFNSRFRPAICSSFKADPEICGTNGEEATKLIRWYEKETRP